MGNLVSRLLFQPPVPTYRYEDRINFWLFTRLGEKIPAFYINQQCVGRPWAGRGAARSRR